MKFQVIWGTVFSTAITLAVLAPLKEDFRGTYGDSFPFSWYPMFSRPRPDLERANYVEAVGPKGEQTVLRSRHYVIGAMNQARRQIDKLVRKEGGAKRVCERAALSVGKAKRGALAQAESVRVLRGWFDMKEYFHEQNRKPVRIRVLATCEVDRDAPAEEGK